METTTSNWQAIRPVAHMIVAVVMFYASMQMTAPFLVDMLVDNICEDHTECSQLISMMGVQQAVRSLSPPALSLSLSLVSLMVFAALEWELNSL